MNRQLAQELRSRAKGRCEYCHLPASIYPLPFHVDHIVASQHGGKTVLENLALACLHCNRHRGPNIAGTDPETGEMTRLFHPRQHVWSDHFMWNGAQLSGRTGIGRVTIDVLAINHSDFLAMRKTMFEEQVFPLE